MPFTELEELDLGGNKLGGTITADVAIFTKLKKLQLKAMGLDGKTCMSQHTCVVRLLSFPSRFAGELPKLLPVSLEVLNLGDEFTGGIPSEWGALTNLKELRMVACGLDGELCMPQHTYVFVRLADISFFCAGELPKELGNLVNLTKLILEGNQFRGKLYVPDTCVVCLLTFSRCTGELPKELGKLANLTKLYLNMNKFQGEFVCSVLHSHFGPCT